MPAGLEFPLRAPRRLTLEAGALINRGLRDVAPKYLDTTKVASSLLRQISNNRAETVGSTNVYMPFAGNEADRLAQLLPESHGISISAPLLGSMIDRIYSFTGRTAMVVVANMEPSSHESLAPFARALINHDRQLELTLAKDLTNRARDIDLLASKDHRFDREAIVVEERGGKFSQLALEEPTIRLQLKKWVSTASMPGGREPKGEARAPIDTPPGFGAGAAILSDATPSQNNRSRSLFFAASSIKLTDVMSVETVAQWKYAAHLWLKDLGIPADSIKRVYVSTPYLAISAFIGQAFGVSDTKGHFLMYPDQVYGWHPLLTLLAMIRQPMLPALFVHGGTGPAVHVAAVWAAP